MKDGIAILLVVMVAMLFSFWSGYVEAKKRYALEPTEQVFLDNARQALKEHIRKYGGLSTNDQWRAVITRIPTNAP